jgi:hypothetical protein
MQIDRRRGDAKSPKGYRPGSRIAKTKLIEHWHQPAETLREGEEIAEKIAATHGLPVVRLTPAESAQEQTIDAIYIVERRTVSR